MDEQIKFTIVIVTYNRVELLKECIACAFSQSYPANNIIIVNNASTDNTKEYLDSLLCEKLKIIHEEINGGGTKGFTIAMKSFMELEDEWIVLIDDDAMLERDFLKAIKDEIINSRNVSAFSGVVKTDGKIDIRHRRRIINRIKFLLEEVSEKEYELPVFEHEMASFCGLCINKELIKKIGFPISNYFIWMDDSEYSMRICKNSKLLNVNGAILNHKVKFLENGEFNWKSYYGERNKIDLIKKHLGMRATIWAYGMLLFKILKCFIGILVKANKERRIKYIKMYKDVLVDSVRGRLGANEKYLP